MGFIYGDEGWTTLTRKSFADERAGVVTIFQYGAGSAGVMRLLGKYMVGSGATFA
jgi:Reactive mitochondrial oxygen species modulator 1